MPVSLAFTPGSIIRWHDRRFVVIECAALDSIVAREVGKRRLDRIPVNEAQPDYPVDDNTSSQMNLISVPEGQWVAASSRFDLLKPLLDMDSAERTRAHVEQVAKSLNKHPTTIYRWIDAYNRSGRVSVFLSRGRSDRGKSRLSKDVDAIIENAINKIYLTAEKPPVTAVIEEVELQCFQANVERPNSSTVRRRIAMLSDRLKLEKRKSIKAAARKYEPIRGHFPGADAPLAVAQIDHTPMDVIVVDEEHRQPRKVKKLDLLEFNDGCGMSRRSEKGPELDVTRCYIGLETGA